MHQSRFVQCIVSMVFLVVCFLSITPNVYAQTETKTTANAQTDSLVDINAPLHTILQIPIPFVARNCFEKNSDNVLVPAVCDVTDYIKGMYRLLIGLGALFAVIMIIVGGYEWIFSGGSSDRVGSAKKRIFGAVIGLILALLSFVILNTITPRLVAFRLPKVEPVKTIYGGLGDSCLAFDFVKQNPNAGLKKFTEYNNKDTNTAVVDPELGNPVSVTSPAETLCGKTYIQDGSVSTCKGVLCDPVANPRTTCIKNKCEPYVMYGNITWGIGAGDFSNIFSNAYVDSIQLIEARDGDGGRTINLTEQFVGTSKASAFRLPYKDGDTAYSSGPDSLGYILIVEVNDATDWLPTLDDFFLVGKDPSDPQTCFTKALNVDSSGKYISVKSPSLVDLTPYIDYLWTGEQVKNGIRCDLSIKRSFFPAD